MWEEIGELETKGTTIRFKGIAKHVQNDEAATIRDWPEAEAAESQRPPEGGSRYGASEAS